MLSDLSSLKCKTLGSMVTRGKFHETSLPDTSLKLETFTSNYWNIFLEPVGSAITDFKNVLVSALAEPLTQMLKLVDSGLKFCKQRLRYGYHN